MKALAIIFRLLSLFTLIGLGVYTYLKWEKEKEQSNAFLDDQVENGYAILQSTKKAQWGDISKKKIAFRDVFLDNQPVGLNDENPLEEALSDLKTSENIIWRGKDYRDEYDALSMEFGPGTYFWNPDSIDPVTKKPKPKWEVYKDAKDANNTKSLKSIATLKNPFVGIPKDEDEIDEETGKVITKAVPRENRLLTVLGMLYKDRHDMSSELTSLRSNIVERDLQLRESQNLFNDMKTQKEEWEAKSNEFELKLQNTEADLAEEKKLRQDEKEASEQQIMVLNDNIAGLEQQKIDTDKKHITEIDSLKEEHGTKISQLTREIQLADAAGYQRGIDEMLAKERGGTEGLDPTAEADLNPFITKADGPPQLPPDTATEETTELTNVMSEYGIPSSIARIDPRAGMLMLPIGSDRGMSQGGIFTLWKGKKEAARIKVQSTQKGYSIAYILPRFGEPNRLRSGDMIQIVPEKKNTL
jgi:hypothetical protein